MKKILITLAMLFMTTMAVQATDGHMLKGEIEAQNAKLLAAFNSGDAAGVAALYTVDGVLMAPGGPRSVGKEAIEAAFAGMSSGPKLELSLATDSVKREGSVAIEVGAWEMKIMPEGMEPAMDNGDYVVIWKKVGDEWLLYIDIFNSNNPPATN